MAVPHGLKTQMAVHRVVPHPVLCGSLGARRTQVCRMDVGIDSSPQVRLD